MGFSSASASFFGFRLENQSPELQRYDGHRLDAPEEIPSAIQEEVKFFGVQLEDQITAEHPYEKSFGTNLLEESTDADQGPHQHTFVSPTPPAQPSSSYHNCRFLLYHSGLMSAWRSPDSSVSLLDKTDARLLLHIGALDKQFGFAVFFFSFLLFFLNCLFWCGN